MPSFSLKTEGVQRATSQEQARRFKIPKIGQQSVEPMEERRNPGDASLLGGVKEGEPMKSSETTTQHSGTITLDFDLTEVVTILIFVTYVNMF